MNKKNGLRLAYELTAATETEAEILIYSEISQEKWFGDEVTATDFDKLLKDAKKNGAKSLRLRINSPGGSVNQAVAIKTMVENSDFEELHIDIEGLCASAATFFLCIAGAQVRIADGSEVMIHNPSTYAYGTAQDFSRIAERLGKMAETQYHWYAEKTGQSEEQIKSWMDAETWFTAKEAVQYGFADEVMETGDAAALADGDVLEVMRQMYKAVPEEIVRNGGTQVASGNPTENKNTNNQEEDKEMDVKELTEDQLREGNPQLFDSLVHRGETQERERIRKIETLTDEGFEELAQKAKEDGTSAADFLEQVITERAKKKAAFRAARQQETAPASQVTGGAPADNDGPSEAEELDKFAKEMAKLTPNKGVYEV